MSETKSKPPQTGLEIAVIGMAGRFPQANDIETFWENLKNGKETITFFSDDELLEAGITPETVKSPNYVKAKGYVGDTRYFDAAFFNYTPKEAEIMDPQVRVFHEICWHALENAGYDPQTYTGLIGLYAGYNPNIAWKIDKAVMAKGGSELLEIEYLNSSYFSTLLCYKLNLKGPGVTVNTACSTSLAAIHLAGRALLTGEADIVLAGGVSITLPVKCGFYYEEGMIMSPEGRCYPFDERANGTASGNGAGVVVLKRLVRAVKDRDYIYAVIKGTAMNNDGNRKPGYTAPSVEAQAEVIKAAMRMAEVDPQSITFIESHGTGTPLGDPIEYEALKKAYSGTPKKKFCRIGTLKANIGHLDAAAGVSGFIKTALALDRRLIPPSIHFKTPNNKIDLENSPFYINTEPEEWQPGETPRRAGVSSFGIGGTNVHIILEEAPENLTQAQPENSSQLQNPHTPTETNRLIVLSAKSQTALENMTRNLAQYLRQNPGVNLGDVAYTLQVGRQAFNYRRALVSPEKNENNETAATRLEAAAADSRITYTEPENRPIIFMFPGLGTQYTGMGTDLYLHEPIFRETMDRCIQILNPLLGFDLKEILYPENSNPGKPGNETSSFSTPSASSSSSAVKTGTPGIQSFEVAQAVVFSFEYALAQLLQTWGIKPHTLIGYSFGEYVAATLAGVFTLEDALKLVALRGKLIGKLPPGGMLSVPLPKENLEPLLNENISIAIDNGESCIVAGPLDHLEAFEKQMKEKRYLCVRLEATHALHTRMMDAITPEFTARVGEMTLEKPTKSFISNVTGKAITAADATNPRYWAVHLRQIVRYAEGMRELTGIDNAIFLEVGPGVVLSTMAHQLIRKEANQGVINLVRAPGQKIGDKEYLLKKIGDLWKLGARIDWEGFYGGEKRKRNPLPGYPFDREAYRDTLSGSYRAPAAQTINPTFTHPVRENEVQPAPRPEHKIPYTAPRDQAEQLFVNMWEDILGIKPIGIHDNLLEMGVNSLKGITFVNRFKEQLGEIIHITAIFDAPTAAELAAYFARHYPESFARVTGRQSGAVNPEEGRFLRESQAEPQNKEEVTMEKIQRYRRFLPLLSEPANGDTPPNPRAVFVLSPPRTGSTLLRVMLGGHPSLFAPPELNLLSFNTLRGRKNTFAGPGESNLQGTLRALMSIKKCSAEQAAQIMEEFEQQDISVKEFYARLQEWVHPQLLVDKSPGYTNDLEILKRAELYFHEPMYIHLLRHPYGMIHSFVEAKMDLLTGEQITGALGLSRRELAEVIYTNSESNIVEFLKQVPPERQLQVKFEDLATNPEETARAICRFLNLKFQEGMVQPYREKEKRMTDGVYTEGQMIGDMKFHQHKKIESEVAERWQKEIREDFLGEPTLEIAALFGYKPLREVKSSGNGKPGNLVPLTGGADAETNIFFLHERAGDVGGYIELCTQLGSRYNCWGIQAEKLRYYAPRNITVEETAARYIQQIKQVQPEGPYYLGAWSFGGNLAFEMTRQLEQKGERIALLAFIDCAGPLGRIHKETLVFSPETEKEFLQAFFAGSEIEAKLRAMTRMEHIWPFVVDILEASQVHVEGLKHLLRGYENAIPDYRGLGVRELIGFLNTDRTFKNAGAGYIPRGKIQTPIHFFTASESKGVDKEYWNEYCHEPLIYHDVQGDHHSIFRQPGVKEFARLFAEVLAEPGV